MEFKPGDLNWAYPQDQTKGLTLPPLYRTVPPASLADPALHRLLALLDALRTGRARERALAAKLMEAELMRPDMVASAGI